MKTVFIFIFMRLRKLKNRWLIYQPPGMKGLITYDLPCCRFLMGAELQNSFEGGPRGPLYCKKNCFYALIWACFGKQNTAETCPYKAIKAILGDYSNFDHIGNGKRLIKMFLRLVIFS